MFNAGVIYMNGDGIDKNYTKAVEFFENAGEHGESSALFNLGMFYLNGEGVEKNIEKAKDYFKRSGDLGNSKGSNMLQLLSILES